MFPQTSPRGSNVEHQARSVERVGGLGGSMFGLRGVGLGLGGGGKK